MHTLVTKITAVRAARRQRVAERSQLLWEERRRTARRYAAAEPLRFRIA
jgi:hypothetical protein